VIAWIVMPEEPYLLPAPINAQPVNAQPMNVQP
jgi:hypothetical protein